MTNALGAWRQDWHRLLIQKLRTPNRKYNSKFLEDRTTPSILKIIQYKVIVRLARTVNWQLYNSRSIYV
jgi:hypothetical protein